MNIEYSRKFIKEFKKCPAEIKQALKKRLIIFADNKFDPILNNHQLFGRLKGYRSINVNGDWRAIFEEVAPDSVYFVAIGPHSKLYS